MRKMSVNKSLERIREDHIPAAKIAEALYDLSDHLACSYPNDLKQACQGLNGGRETMHSFIIVASRP